MEVLSLSVNGITSLKHFMHCTALRELYLRKNMVTELSDIRSAVKAWSIYSGLCNISLCNRVVQFGWLTFDWSMYQSNFIGCGS